MRIKNSMWVACILLLAISCSPPRPTDVAATARPAGGAPALAQLEGVGAFRDKFATADQFVLELSGITAPPGGQAYQGWLLGEDGTSVTSIGVLAVGSDGNVKLEWNSPNGENLLARYARFHATLEPAGGSASPTGKIVYAGGLEGAALAQARQLFVKSEIQVAAPGGCEAPTPLPGGDPMVHPEQAAQTLNTALAIGLVAQTQLAVQHVQNAANAAAIGSQPEMRSHLEHVINILDGAAGPRFGDHTGDGRAENPGDGLGVLNYLKHIAALYADDHPVSVAAQAQVDPLEAKCLEIIQAQDLAAAAPQLRELEAMAGQFQTGSVATLYQALQEMTSFKIVAVQ